MSDRPILPVQSWQAWRSQIVATVKARVILMFHHLRGKKQ